MINNNFTNYLSSYLVRICLIVVGIIGLSVIIGWHTHILTLVQVIPGAIPMQYNTALCLIALAVSSGAMVLDKFRILSLVGSILVCAIGIMVVFQYLTGVSLGIDTFFFYPWNQTLSADPGRMALTTALCFAIAGGTLCLLQIKPRSLIVFVLANTFPLSLGLTSLLGYVFGITYVLPFHLGSQMAIHTATAFTIYGGAMLFYAWNLVPKTSDGLPKWMPGIAVVMAPVFFFSLNSALQINSLAARIVQFILAFLGTGLLALALHKLMQTSILSKGLILISVPLLFVLGFVLLVNQQKRTSETAQVKALHSKEVITNIHTLTENLVQAQSGIRGYIITEDISYLKPYEMAVLQIPEETKRLQTLLSDNPEQLTRAETLISMTTKRLEGMIEVKNMVRDGKQTEAIARVKSGTGKQLLDDFRNLKDIMLAEEERLDEIRRKNVQESWQQFDWLLVAGTSADLLLASTLAFLFTRGIGRRLQTLTENSQALAEGNKLAPPLTGNDEIARLDSVFHHMADALQQAQAELESKVVERTRELSQATKEIKKLNETLEQRVIDRTKQLEEANKEMEAFSYSVSHDLRAPLRAIDGFSNIFLEDHADKLDDEGLNLLNVIRRNTKNMGQLIDDLLSLSRLGRKQMESELIDMSELARDVCTLIEAESPIRNLKIELLPKTVGDKSLLRQVFINLIANAVKYSRTKENALIEVGGYVEKGENIYYIRDQGVGFDMKYASKLFGVFQRLHSAKDFEGTGVGLAIVQRIIHRHGGRIWAEGEVNKGSTFYFALPIDFLNQQSEESRDPETGQ